MDKEQVEQLSMALIRESGGDIRQIKAAIKQFFQKQDTEWLEEFVSIATAKVAAQPDANDWFVWGLEVAQQTLARR